MSELLIKILVIVLFPLCLVVLFNLLLLIACIGIRMKEGYWDLPTWNEILEMSLLPLVMGVFGAVMVIVQL